MIRQPPDLQGRKPGNRVVAQRVATGQPRLVSDSTGRIPAFIPTDEQREIVTVLIANGTTVEIVAQVIGCSTITLHKYFSQEIESGRALVTARVGHAVATEALNGNMSAARYWLTCHGGPEWNPPRNAFEREEIMTDRAGVIHFFLPRNGRDEPEPDEPPTIDATGTDDT